MVQFSLHLSMAQECMDIFERDKLPVVATVEQVCMLVDTWGPTCFLKTHSRIVRRE